jgi:preprotein translocase subunit SecY
VLDFFNMFSGGSLQRMSLIALGVMPYITASIVMQLATTMSPQLAALKKEGESGRKKINQYTRYGTVFLCAIQGYFMAVGLETWGASEGHSAVLDPGMLFRVTTVINLVGGTMFLMWLGEQITSRGIGNGVSLIIMAGIVAQLPRALGQMLEGGRTGSLDPMVIMLIVAMAVAVSSSSCFMERAQRRLLIQYPKRQTAATACSAGALASAAEAQHLGRDPADLRLVAAAAAADRRPVPRPARAGADLTAISTNGC